MPKLSLRPEARPFTRESLTDSQRKILDRVVALLRDALDQLDQSEREVETEEAKKFPLRLQTQSHRINPVIMVSGGRGTGKTSLLLTLQREMLLASPPTAPSLIDLQQRLVWLETLDLEPLPQQTGLMAGIMARIEQAINEDASKKEFLGRPHTEFATAVEDLNNLALDVCLAWDRDNPARGDNADADQYARELMKVEKARTNLRVRFAKLLSDLATFTPWKSERRKPLFVLPVDDIDLNPARCLELLRLVRSLATPRFVVLLFGDYDIARLVVNLNFLKELGGLLPDHRLGTDKVRTSIDAQAFCLGAEAIRKMLPPNQRFRIEGVSIEEALRFQPQGGETLGNRLGKIIVPSPLDPSTTMPLNQWMADAPPWPTGERTSGWQVLKASLRKLTDLGILLDDLTTSDSNDTERLRSFIGMLWLDFQHGLVEDGVVKPTAEQEEVEYRRDAVFPYGPFRLEFARLPKSTNQITALPFSKLELRFPAEAELIALPNQDITAGASTPTPQTTGQAILLHDLMTVAKETAVKPLAIPQIEELGLVLVQWQFDGGTACTSAWPGPTLATAWELELFLAHWKRYRPLWSPNGPAISTEGLMPEATFWLALCGAFAFKSKALWDMVKKEDIDLSKVVEVYAAQIPDAPRGRRGSRSKPASEPTEPSPSAAAWLQRTAVFLSVENFVDTVVAAYFHDNAKLKAFWSQTSNFHAIRNQRKQSLTNSNALIAHALLNPAKYTDGVETLLKRASDLASDIHGRAQQAGPFRLGTPSIPKSDALAKAIDKALTNVTKHPQGLIDENASTLYAARVSIAQLRQILNLRHTDGMAMRDDLDMIQKQLMAIEGTLTLLREARDHPVNRFNNGEFCPELPSDEVTV